MIIAKTPLRISFAGGGSDIPAYYEKFGGATVSTAINKYVYVAVNKHFDPHELRVSYSKTELVPHVDQVEHKLVKACLKHLGIRSGLEIVTIADVPSKGTGLGSSSSFTVGLLNALHAHSGRHISEDLLAEEACTIEIGRLGEPIGKQDQYIASFGGLRFIEYLPNGEVAVENLSADQETRNKIEQSILLFYTGLTRGAGSILHAQIENYSSDKHIQNVKALVRLAHELRKELNNHSATHFGEILDQSWQIKKSLSDKICSPEIDGMYEAALSAGAEGGKLLGAGGGGFLLIYAHPDKHAAIRAALADYREMPVGFEPAGSKIFSI